jgi:hypothetical protein
MNDIEIKTVDTLLDKGVRVQIPAPFFLQLFGKKTINVIVHRSVMQNMFLISKKYVQLNVQEDFGDDFSEWTKIFINTCKPVSEIVAIGMLHGTFATWLFTKPLAVYLRRHVNSRELASIAAMLVTLNGVQDFLNTIKFLRTMRITKPRNLSPDGKGSQQAG